MPSTGSTRPTRLRLRDGAAGALPIFHPDRRPAHSSITARAWSWYRAGRGLNWRSTFLRTIRILRAISSVFSRSMLTREVLPARRIEVEMINDEPAPKSTISRGSSRHGFGADYKALTLFGSSEQSIVGSKESLREYSGISMAV